MSVLRLTGARKPYAWAHPTAINELIGAASDPPIAEVWLGAHPGGSADAEGMPLVERIAADPVALLGREVHERFGGLPFLPKLLAAGSPLSIQTHPDAATARAGFDAEEAAGVPRDAPERNYRDANHKPELICAITQFDALCGFRKLGACRTLFATLDAPALDPVRAVLDQSGEDATVLAATLAWILDLDASVAGPMVDAAVDEIGTARPGSLEAEWLPRIAAAYPGDPGALVALLLNPVRLQPGEAIFLGAGNLHAYLHGLGVEVMANSDNVIRGGLTPKHVDIEELTRIVDATPLDVAEIVQHGDGGRYDVPVPEFSLHRCDLGPNQSFAFGDGPEVVIVTEGHAFVGADGDIRLGAGEAAFIPAGDPHWVSGRGVVFIVGVGEI